MEDAEGAKLKAEEAKLKAEEAKLTAEAAYFARPFWQRTEALGLAGSILVAAIGLGGVIWTQSIKDRIQELDRAVATLNEQKKALDDTKKALEPKIDELTARKEALERDNSIIAGNVAILAEKSAARSKENEDLLVSAHQLRADLDKMQQEAPFWKVDALVEQVRLHYEHHNQFSPIESTLVELLNAASEPDKQKWSDRIEKAASDPSSPSRYRVSLIIALWEGTRLGWFRHQLVHFAQDYFFGLSVTDDELRHENQNIIAGRIWEQLDLDDRRFLMEALWNDDLEDGKKLDTFSFDRLFRFVQISPEAIDEHPEYFFLPLANLQSRLLQARTPGELGHLADAIIGLSPQCFVLTWYFGGADAQWQSFLSPNRERAENIMLSTLNLRQHIDLNVRPTRGSDSRSLDAWKRNNSHLVAFWVPITYESSVYDPLRRVARKIAIGESDLPSAK
ncbi:MAG: hypothetical protein ACLQOO_05840 [Terriglobia bacterium]